MSSVDTKLDLDSIIIRFSGEIGIKGPWTRRIYEHRLLKNVKSRLKCDRIAYEGFLRKYGRLYLKTSSIIEASVSLSKVFGISSVSPAIQTTSNLSNIVFKSVSLASLVLNKGNCFSVRCRRVGNHPYKSFDVCKKVGHRILTELPELELTVNLRNPDVTFGVEIRDEHAFIFSSTLGGVGGLPLGTQPKVICLLKGDVNSSVACWLTMKRGCPIVPVHFDNASSEKSTTGTTLDITRVLFDWATGFSRKMYVVPNSQNLALFEEFCDKKLVPVLNKRLMYRISERIAEMEKAEGIVTGETIEEWANQTLHNLRLSNMAIHKYPVHRLLVGFNKNEIEEMARKIGTYGFSKEEISPYVSAAPKKLASCVSLEEIFQAEKRLNSEEIVEESIKSLKSMTL